MSTVADVLSTISGIVYVDPNNTGAYVAVHRPGTGQRQHRLPDRHRPIRQCGVVVDRHHRNSAGGYSFNNMVSGNYNVVEFARCRAIRPARSLVGTGGVSGRRHRRLRSPTWHSIREPTRVTSILRKIRQQRAAGRRQQRQCRSSKAAVLGLRLSTTAAIPLWRIASTDDSRAPESRFVLFAFDQEPGWQPSGLAQAEV